MHPLHFLPVLRWLRWLLVLPWLAVLGCARDDSPDTSKAGAGSGNSASPPRSSPPAAMSASAPRREIGAPLTPSPDVTTAAGPVGRPAPSRTESTAPLGAFSYGVDVTSDSWTLQAFVHPNLPPFRFRAPGAVSESESGAMRVGDFRGLEILTNDDNGRRQVLRASKWFQDHPLELVAPGRPHELDYGDLWLADLNFDEYVDVALLDSRTISGRKWDAWLFDPKKKVFIAVTLPENAFLDATNETVRSVRNQGCCLHWDETYRWDGQRLRLMRSFIVSKERVWVETHVRRGTLRGRAKTSHLKVRSNPTKSDCLRSHDCLTSGDCTPVGTTCEATAKSCRTSEACRAFGQCGFDDGVCVASAEGCAGSEACRREGLCDLRNDPGGEPHCVPTVAGCAASNLCKQHGFCDVLDGECSPSDAGCAGSTACRDYGRCVTDGVTCVTNDQGCAGSTVCKEQNRCRAQAGLCVE